MQRHESHPSTIFKPIFNFSHLAKRHEKGGKNRRKEEKKSEEKISDGDENK